jgi:hypothetical protein
VERLRLAGEEWVNLDAAANLLERTKDTLLAQIMKQQGDISAAKAEMLAKADPRYANHLEMMVEARRKAMQAKVRYDSGHAFIDMARSHESTKRAEMQIAGRA